MITCGYNNSYKHPHVETLKTLQRNDVQLYRSDIHGKIVLISDGKTITVETEKE